MPRVIPVPSGSLDPPRRNPPTAVAADSSDPGPASLWTLGDALRGFLGAVSHAAPATDSWRRWATRALDIADVVAAPIAQILQR
jgi:hypothetical protein